jgi:hypothetical protein
MGTVMQRENERGRLMVPACSTELSTRIERQSGGLAAAGQEELAALRESVCCGRLLPRMHLTELEETFSQRHHWRVPTVLCGAEDVLNPDPYDFEASDCPGCVDCLRYCPACVDAAARWFARTDQRR